MHIFKGTHTLHFAKTLTNTSDMSGCGEREGGERQRGVERLKSPNKFQGGKKVI